VAIKRADRALRNDVIRRSFLIIAKFNNKPDIPKISVIRDEQPFETQIECRPVTLFTNGH
jgi:hypothetical protein